MVSDYDKTVRVRWEKETPRNNVVQSPSIGMRHRFHYYVTVECNTCGEDDSFPYKWQAQEWAREHAAEHNRWDRV